MDDIAPQEAVVRTSLLVHHCGSVAVFVGIFAWMTTPKDSGWWLIIVFTLILEARLAFSLCVVCTPMSSRFHSSFRYLSGMTMHV